MNSFYSIGQGSYQWDRSYREIEFIHLPIILYILTLKLDLSDNRNNQPLMGEVCTEAK